MFCWKLLCFDITVVINTKNWSWSRLLLDFVIQKCCFQILLGIVFLRKSLTFWVVMPLVCQTCFSFLILRWPILLADKTGTTDQPIVNLVEFSLFHAILSFSPLFIKHFSMFRVIFSTPLGKRRISYMCHLYDFELNFHIWFKVLLV